MGMKSITICNDCDHCFKNRRSQTGYSCEVWGYDDFACDVPLDGYCFKAKPKNNLKTCENINNVKEN